MKMRKIFVSAIALLATCSLYAQSVTETFNAAAKAYSEKPKNFAAAAQGFEKVIDMGIDDEEAASMVATAKKYLPNCYFMMGGAAFQKGDLDAALQNFTKSAELAELYGETTALNKANTWIANVYSKKGADAFNNNDFAAASEIFAKGYAANPRNTDMALNLAKSYCEMGEFEKGMDVYDNVVALGAKNPKYAEDAAAANEQIAYYTLLKVADLQKAGDNDAIIAMAETMLEKNPANPVAHKVRLDAYNAKKDYAKVIELGEAAAAAQGENAEDKSMVYYTLGLAYNAKEMKPQAIAALKQVTAGAAVEPAKAALAELSK